MIGKLISFGLVGSLAIALVGGSAYILTTNQMDTAAQAEGERILENGIQMAAGNTDRNKYSGAAVREDRQSAGLAENDPVRGDSSNRGNAEEFSAQASSLVLTAEETAGLTALLEEEKLARDVYLAFFQQWDYAAFQNIADSEQTHMSALRGILERGGVSDPTVEYGVGEFPTPAFQDLYNLFTLQGGESLAAALKAGAAIEEMDILDIEQLQSETDDPELLRVYENLRRGSVNHLRAFRSTYEQRTGVTYIPQYMTQEEYDALMGGEIQGYRGGGQSEGRKGKGGA